MACKFAPGKSSAGTLRGISNTKCWLINVNIIFLMYHETKYVAQKRKAEEKLAWEPTNNLYFSFFRKKVDERNLSLFWTQYSSDTCESKNAIIVYYLKWFAIYCVC